MTDQVNPLDAEIGAEMTDPTLEAVAEGERRALREWQQEHQEPCDECEWIDDRTMAGDVTWCLAHPCPKHGGRP